MFRLRIGAMEYPTLDASKRKSLKHWAHHYGILERHLAGILAQESGGKCVKPYDGLGPASYFQITSCTAKDIESRWGHGKIKFCSFGSECRAAAWLLKNDGYRRGHRILSIAAYNSGAGNPWLGIRNGYARKVLAWGKAYKRRYG